MRQHRKTFDPFVDEINGYVLNITGAILFFLCNVFLLIHVADAEKLNWSLF